MNEIRLAWHIYIAIWNWDLILMCSALRAPSLKSHEIFSLKVLWAQIILLSWRRLFSEWWVCVCLMHRLCILVISYSVKRWAHNSTFLFLSHSSCHTYDSKLYRATPIVIIVPINQFAHFIILRKVFSVILLLLLPLSGTFTHRVI